jgi:transposase-like protein
MLRVQGIAVGSRTRFEAMNRAIELQEAYVQGISTRSVDDLVRRWA